VSKRPVSETCGSARTHEEGTSAVPVDEFYSTCAGQYLAVGEREKSIYFEVEEDGIVSPCGFVSDDCLQEIRISFFNWK
jgi:hypothetical protein